MNVEADVVLLPEYANVYPAGIPTGELRGRAESIEESVFAGALEWAAAEYGVYVFSGFLEKSGDCIYSSVVMARPSGGVEAVYRKVMLFDALGYRESDVLCRGGDPPRLVEAAGLRVGAIVCFELRFPEMARGLALQGAELVLVPAAWYRGPGKEEQLRFLAQARASENTVYLAVASMAGPDFVGRSMLVDPMGFVAVDAGAREAYVEAVVDKDYLRDVRKALPLLELQPVARRAMELALEKAEPAEDDRGG
ncbi:carbon-nitrogen hydrolase family protein [Pyrodictium abyssi]|uniref:Carbon-nitrogen hydrolase family protein n=2 Tax=Pyrodictium abyssi TaxID=54256 RepID=A0ABN6ZW99_9CREN|nr:carbon-nitrogen hydrolase family protein [Pyrodictium abyssi]